MASNWISTFAPIQNTTGNQSITDNVYTIDDLFNIKKDENVDQLITVKESILELIQKKDEINLVDHDEEYKNEEIDEFILKIKDYIQSFNEKQVILDKKSEEIQKELHIIKQNINTVENMIDFIKKLPNDYSSDESTMKIIEQMHTLSKDIISNKKITVLKKGYIDEYKKIQKYLHLIRVLNNFNTSNICPLCFTNQVDHFMNPCGHTFCKECLKTNFNKDDTTLYEIGRNNHTTCPICRDTVQKLNKLYFL